uniref:KIND domain-containing protein n=1 Tax=Cyprinodon variegatus TaxID=28743 RepID=A0A3Q2EHL8_CYPVA
MAERRSGGEHRALTEAAAHRGEQNDAMNSAEDLSLEEILRLYSQPVNEEQAWAVCYQCCRSLEKAHRGEGGSAAASPRRICGPEDVRIQRDGSVKVDQRSSQGKIAEQLGSI